MIYFLKLDIPHSPILGLRHGMDAEVAKPADIKGRKGDHHVLLRPFFQPET